MSTKSAEGMYVASFKRKSSSSSKAGMDLSDTIGEVSEVVPVAEEDSEVLWVDGYENLAAGKALDSDANANAGGRRDDEEEWLLPENVDDLSPEVLASLPAHIRKSLIEDARRRQRNTSRAHYLPVAGDPALYSQTQLSNFLNSRWATVASIDPLYILSRRYCTVLCTLPYCTLPHLTSAAS